jgi:hypothetical protein
LPEKLYLYRQHPASASIKRMHSQIFNKAVALERTIYRRFGSNPGLDKFRNVARDYLYAAIIGCGRTDIGFSKNSLGHALSFNPHLLDEDQPLENMIRSFTPADSPEAALFYINLLFQELLPRDGHLGKMKSRLLSDIHMAEVFRGNQQNNRELIDKNIWPGIRHNPSWLLNPGVLAIIFKLPLHKIK